MGLETVLNVFLHYLAGGGKKGDGGVGGCRVVDGWCHTLNPLKSVVLKGWVTLFIYFTTSKKNKISIE